ncbi:thiaminase II [Sneathiella chinensis]|uniref:Aminopyrimidine aminohydrolase n=1 Tax=Sneathiella chinensis TaxID=349750 RepID=A0ABQ5U5V6_9PROT|nr:thiaminase II [Sneathiella chinensis]GLQ07545.1 aminopyrimidine aminohydrolase [Sneathiella chinensis]
MTLFSRLKAANPSDWQAYITHDFVQGLGRGDLPREAFEFYLKQDYLFLIHFARAYALAAYKSDNLDDLKAAAKTVNGLVDTEMSLHVKYCAGWGISEAEMQQVTEAPENMAYTRYVLERGMAGDILDLYVALAPCIVGYGEIGRALMDNPATVKEGNPYLPWIEVYASDDYQEMVEDSIRQIDRLAESRFTEKRFDSLSKTFGDATRLEISFWQMGLNAL